MLNNYKTASHGLFLAKSYGKVSQFIGMVIEVKGLTAAIGEYCEIHSEKAKRNILAEVVGFKNNSLLLMPFEKGRGITLGDYVSSYSQSAKIAFSEQLLGRAIDPFCRVLDTNYAPILPENLELYPKPNNPLRKEKIITQLYTGVKAIDKFTPLGQGQRIGLFAGSGVGKTTLLKMLTENVDADIKVIVLLGERGREVADFFSMLNKDSSAGNFILVAAAADQPPLTRVHSIFTATAIAEYFCDQGKNVLLIVDSITRFAMAQREIGLAIGEPPTTKGYTPSVFSQIPLLLERVGNYRGKGSITGIYTVLVEGGDLDEPISDLMRSVLDGHIVLTRELAEESVYPPIDILKSKSRIADSIVSYEQIQSSNELIKKRSKYQSIQDLIEMGMYKKGDSVENDQILLVKKKIDQFISQLPDERITKEKMIRKITTLEKELC